MKRWPTSFKGHCSVERVRTAQFTYKSFPSKTRIRVSFPSSRRSRGEVLFVLCGFHTENMAALSQESLCPRIYRLGVLAPLKSQQNPWMSEPHFSRLSENSANNMLLNYHDCADQRQIKPTCTCSLPNLGDRYLRLSLWFCGSKKNGIKMQQTLCTTDYAPTEPKKEIMVEL